MNAELGVRNFAMNDQFARTELIFGKDGMSGLFAACVAVFGVGGVGGYAVEALARSGVGRIDIFDHDRICPTNINRQLHALHSNIGQYKVDVARQRILDINPQAVVNAYKIFYLPDTSSQVDLTQYDYIIDAIDTVSGKIELVVKADEHNIPIISSMGAGNKIDATAFEVTDIYKTSACPLAAVMRRELRRRNIKKLKVVYSKEAPKYKGTTPGSTAFVPPTAGLIIAGEVVKQLVNS
jgi:tRNA A37 threonylcarbamoyladenosine dehydratase